MNKSTDHTISSNIKFPYANDANRKRTQLWSNLQHGLLLELEGTFVPWGTTYQDLSLFGSERIDQNDRIIWNFGKRTILDGLESPLHILQWLDSSRKAKIDTFIEAFGQDYRGYDRFKIVRGHLTKKLGEPNNSEMKPAGPMKLGLIEWKQNNVEITLTGIEHFSYRYSMRIAYKP